MKILLLAILAFILLDVLLVAYVIYRRSRRKLSEKTVHEIRDAWKKLIRIADQRLAIMEADKLLDHALAAFGYKGNLGTKLKVAGGKFKNINKVWAAHKVRNNIAHQINYQLDEKTYRASMLAFKEAFKDLNIF